MTTVLMKNWLTPRNILMLVLGILCVFLLLSQALNKRFSTIENTVRVTVAEQQAVLITIAETIARNGADATTESIVKDCPLNERSKFDTLLGSLDNGLSYAQLTELERLFGRCASFDADRKAVMAVRFAREIEVYETYLEHLAAIEGADVSVEFALASWQELSELETKRSVLTRDLVTIQDNIIQELLSGTAANDQAIMDLLRSASEDRDELSVYKQQAAAIRGDLSSL